MKSDSRQPVSIWMGKSDEIPSDGSVVMGPANSDLEVVQSVEKTN